MLKLVKQVKLSQPDKLSFYTGVYLDKSRLGELKNGSVWS